MAFTPGLLIAAAALTLSACATPPDAAHQHGGAGKMGEMGDMDMKAMCDRHQKTMATKTPEEHAAMMQSHMKNMTPQMMEEHMAMMREKCK